MSAVEDAERAMGEAAAAYDHLDIDAAVAHLSAAIRHFTAADEPRRAAMACARLGDLYGTGMGNLTAARAWFARAQRLVADQPPCIEQGWVAVAAMGCDVDDPDVLWEAAELALDRARRFGDVNLEARPSPTAGSPTCDSAGSTRAWRSWTRRWPWRADRSMTSRSPPSRCARSSPPVSTRGASTALWDGPGLSSARA